eukprot:12901054-Prorocentrum_lima.AAC.1
METGDDGPVWEVKLHFPHELSQEHLTTQMDIFKNKWDTLRPDVSVGCSDKYDRVGDLSDGVYADIHTVSHQDM